MFGVLFLSVAEFLFWEEFEARFNLIAVDYLAYPTEVVGSIHESYPVIPLIIGMMALAAVLWIPLWRSIRRLLAAVPSFAQRLSCTAVHTGAVTAGLLLLSTNSLSFSSNRALNELSMNGIGTFFRAARTDEIDYHQFHRTLPSADPFRKVRDYYRSLGEVYTSEDPSSLVRSHTRKASGLGKLNVVILGEESFGARFVGTYGDTRGLTPNFDRLAKQGLLFAHAYATGTRTVRGLEAMNASFPPIPSESIVKRPGSGNSSTWGAVMRRNGYHTSFIYGGQGTFDNMNTFFGGNGYALSDRLDISNAKFENIWGVSDEDLFMHAINYEAPFYGVDVLDELIPADRPVMFSHNHDISLYQNGVMTVLGLQQEAQTFSYDDEKTELLPLDEERADLLAALLQSAYELFQSRRY
jgi:phosphoglycerol transferase MdoB-like AlkP superfamily enzyme